MWYHAAMKDTREKLADGPAKDGIVAVARGATADRKVQPSAKKGKSGRFAPLKVADVADVATWLSSQKNGKSAIRAVLQGPYQAVNPLTTPFSAGLTWPATCFTKHG